MAYQLIITFVETEEGDEAAGSFYQSMCENLQEDPDKLIKQVSLVYDGELKKVMDQEEEG